MRQAQSVFDVRQLNIKLHDACKNKIAHFRFINSCTFGPDGLAFFFSIPAS